MQFSLFSKGVLLGGGVWELVLDQLNRKARSKVGKSNSPSYGIIDAQSVKTQYASDERGIDGGKKVKGALTISF
jgi:putative transposase